MTFKSTIERVANPRLKSPLASQFSGIVGYQDYVTGKARHLSGIVARGQTLTIRLARPDGAFLADLATGAAAPSRATRRPSGWDQRHPVSRSLLHRVVHASPAARAPTQSQLPRRPPAPARPDRRRDRRRPGARPPADRGRQDRLRTRRDSFATLDHVWRRSTVPAAKPRSRDTSSTSSARRSERGGCT